MVVVIPTHGRPTLLGRTLRSLAACRLPAGYREAIVIENGSRAGAESVVAEIAAAHPDLRLRYLHVERANKSHALNEALATVSGGLAVFFDDDVRLDPGVLEAYAEAAAEHPERAFFGGEMASDFEEAPPEWLLPILPASVRGFTVVDAAEVGYYLGANWAAYVADLQSVGGFDPNFGPGSPTGARGQESEMQGRLRRAGAVPANVAGAVVWHCVPKDRCSPRWAVRRWYRMGTQYGSLAKAGRAPNRLRLASLELVRNAGACVGATIRRDMPKKYLALTSLASEVGYLRGYLFKTS